MIGSTRSRGISFGRYAELWLAQRTDIRARTKEYDGWLITNRLNPAFGQRELAKITPAHVRAWYETSPANPPASPASPTGDARPSSTPPSPTTSS